MTARANYSHNMTCPNHPAVYLLVLERDQDAVYAEIDYPSILGVYGTLQEASAVGRQRAIAQLEECRLQAQTQGHPCPEFRELEPIRRSWSGWDDSVIVKTYIAEFADTGFGMRFDIHKMPLRSRCAEAGCK